MCANYVIFIRNKFEVFRIAFVRHKLYQVPDQLTFYAFLCIKEHFHSAHLFQLWLYESITCMVSKVFVKKWGKENCMEANPSNTIYDHLQ